MYWNNRHKEKTYRSRKRTNCILQPWLLIYWALSWFTFAYLVVCFSSRFISLLYDRFLIQKLNFNTALRAVRFFKLTLDPLLQTRGMKQVIADCLFDFSIVPKLLKAYAAALLVVIISCLRKILCGQNFLKSFEDLFPELLFPLMPLLLKILLPILSSLTYEALESEHYDANAAH